jgi:hypothetical protein
MIKTNFIDVVSTFSKDEFKMFIDFVNSPFHNTNKALVKLADVVKKYYPEFENRNFTKENIYSKVFGIKKYNDQVMRNLMSDALQLSYSFLKVRRAASNTPGISVYLLSELRERKLDSLYSKNMKSAFKEVNHEHSLNFSYFEYLYDLESEVFLNEITHNRQEEVYPVIVKQSEYLTYDYLTKLIHHLIDMDINEKYFQISDTPSIAKAIFASIDLQGIIKHLEATSEKEHSIFSLFYYRAMAAIKGTPEEYQRLKELFFKNAPLFTPAANYVLVTSLETFCIDNIRKDAAKYRNELFEIHKWTIDNDLIKLTKDEFLNMMRFWNIFVNSVEISQTEFAEEFVEKYHHELEPDVRDGLYNLAWAILYFKRKDFHRSLERLNVTRINQFLFKLQIKTYYLRIYYEINDFESAAFALDSYKQFLYKNKKINDSYRESYLNFASVYNDLVKLKLNEKGSSAENIISRIEQLGSVYNKPWLIEKARELIH